MELHYESLFSRVRVLSFAVQMLCLICRECQFSRPTVHAPRNCRNCSVWALLCVKLTFPKIGSIQGSLQTHCLGMFMLLSRLSSYETSTNTVYRHSSVAHAVRASNIDVELHIGTNMVQQTRGRSRTTMSVTTTVPREGD